MLRKTHIYKKVIGRDEKDSAVGIYRLDLRDVSVIEEEPLTVVKEWLTFGQQMGLTRSMGREGIHYGWEKKNLRT